MNEIVRRILERIGKTFLFVRTSADESVGKIEEGGAIQPVALPPQSKARVPQRHVVSSGPFGPTWRERREAIMIRSTPTYKTPSPKIPAVKVRLMVVRNDHMRRVDLDGHDLLNPKLMGLMQDERRDWMIARILDAVRELNEVVAAEERERVRVKLALSAKASSVKVEFVDGVARIKKQGHAVTKKTRPSPH